MSRLAVLGTGLIGASVGMGLRAAGWDVTGWDPDPEALRLAGPALNQAAAVADEAIADADLVLLAGPPATIPAMLASLNTSVLVTDVAGVKLPVIAAARHLDHFVGGHPMAGREVAGPEAASAALFRGAAWVLTTDGAQADDLERMSGVVTKLGARPVPMTAAEHDDAVALISHLPQILAAALVGEASDHPQALGLASGSFRDLTRVASSDPALWADLLIANRDHLAATVASFTGRLERWLGAVSLADATAITEGLERARTIRRDLAPAVVAVQVALADQPGEIARVGHALEASAVDIRDLQLRHAPHGGGGILTLSVRPGEAHALTEALQQEGMLVLE